MQVVQRNYSEGMSVCRQLLTRKSFRFKVKGSKFLVSIASGRRYLDNPVHTERQRRMCGGIANLTYKASGRRYLEEGTEKVLKGRNNTGGGAAPVINITPIHKPCMGEIIS